MSDVVALLDSMWGWGGYNQAGEEAPRYFRINPNNHSGGRLYKFVGKSNRLLVTNSCRVVQSHANSHGIPDINWVKENLIFLTEQGMDLLLVCGTVARKTFEMIASIPIGSTDGLFHISGMKKSVSYYCIDHPAARRWSKESIEKTIRNIERLTACRE